MPDKKTKEFVAQLYEAVNANDEARVQQLFRGLDADEHMKVVHELVNAAVYSNPKIRAPGLDNMRGCFTSTGQIVNRLMHDLSQSMKLTSRGMAIIPTVTFSGSPQPNAYATISGPREITFNFGLLLAFSSMPTITEYLEGVLTSKQFTPYDELERFTPSDQMLHEFDHLMKHWQQSAAQGWTWTTFSPISSSSRHMSWSLFQTFQRFLIAHEFGHWKQSIYKKEELQKLLDITKNHISDWLDSYRSIEPRSAAHIRALLNDPGVLNSWALEVCADQMGYHLLRSSFGVGWDPVLTMYQYAGTAMMFAMQAVLEWFFSMEANSA